MANSIKAQQYYREQYGLKNLAETDPTSTQEVSNGWEGYEQFLSEDFEGIEDPFSSDYMEGSENYGEDPYATLSLTKEGAREMIAELYAWVRENSWGNNRQEIAQRIKEASQLLAKSPGLSPSQAAIEAISTLQGELFGKSLIAGSSYDEFGIDEIIDFEEEDDFQNLGQLKEQLENFKDTLTGTENLNSTVRDDYLAKLEQWIKALELGAADFDEIAIKFEDLKEQISQMSLYSPAAQGLAEMTDLPPEEIENIAKSEGINLNSLPSKPNKSLIEFFAKLSSEVASAIQGVESAIKDRNEFYEKTLKEANAQNAANTRCTSDNDNTDLSSFQALYDLKYHQDSKSQEVMRAMKEANAALQRFLKTVYPDANVDLPDEPMPSGWEGTHQAYLQAGNILFDGQVIDMFNNSTGGLNVGSPDFEPFIQIVTIKIDWEGDGDWEDGPGTPNLNHYGESDTYGSIYDNG